MAKIAIIGAGITGLGAARSLHDMGHEVTVFESETRVGGHTHTVEFELNGRQHAVDTGFIVYNERTYPNFIALLEKLGVQTQPTTMGFSVSNEGKDFEYAGSSLGTLAPSWRQKLSPVHWRFVYDIVRFNRQVKKDLAADQIPASLTLGDYLKQHGFGQRFIHQYLLPMGAAIWSTPEQNMERFEALFFARFFFNHGLLDLVDRPQWFTLIGGSNAYLEPLTQPFKDRLRCASPVSQVKATGTGVVVELQSGASEHFDGVVMACHSDVSQAILKSPTSAQADLLAAVGYLDNEVVLHTDASLMPDRRSCWAAWNYRVQSEQTELPILTYWMNELMCLKDSPEFFVTVNPLGRVDPDKIISTHHYSHPQFTPESPKAQAGLANVNLGQTVVLAGAWARNGFHEDGYTTGLEAAQALHTTLSQVSGLDMVGR